MLHRSRPPRRRLTGLVRGLQEGGSPVVEETVENAASMRDLRAAVARHKPKVVILAESYDDPAACDQDPDRAYRENAEAAISLAAAALEFMARPVLVSTAEVYGQGPGPWSEADPPEPNSNYANSMLRAEQFLARASKLALIVRCSAIYGDGLQDEVERLQGGQGSSSSELLSPISAFELGRAITGLLQAEQTGVVHVVAGGPPASRAEVDQKILEWTGLQPGVLRSPTERRRGHALFGDRLRKFHQPPSWTAALEAAAALAPPPIPEAPATSAPPAAGSLRFASGPGYEAHLHTLAAGERLPNRVAPRPSTLLVTHGKVLVELRVGSAEATDHVLKAKGTLSIPAGATFSLLAADDSTVVELG
ncbi:MAG: sugar nucleotide-binding protein [Deltaproteobacteria bacterium]|nr:sugar nucleotide-binding protein [Deltaproteobacteria bacterium]